jgi:hypothetical protein
MSNNLFKRPEVCLRAEGSHFELLLWWGPPKQLTYSQNCMSIFIMFSKLAANLGSILLEGES